MIKTFNDFWGFETKLKGLDIIIHDNNTFTIQDGVLILNEYQESELEDFKLSKRQIKKLYKEGVLSV